MRSTIVLMTALLASALAGCAALPRAASETQPWPAHSAALQARDHFEIKGRVAVAAGQDGFSANLRWAQTGTQSEMGLEGPLGIGGMRVDVDGATLSVVTPRGERVDNAAAHAQLTSRLGFDPPLSSLRYWILGVPDPSSKGAEVLDGQQRLASLEQNGWHIDYADYVVVQGEWLPGRITLQREGVRVRLIVDHWGS